MKWLNSLSEVQQEKVLNLAEQERPKMKAEQRQSKRDLEEQRRRRLQTAHEKREALRKAQRQRDELSEHHLITSSQELRQAMAMIEVEDSSTSQRRMKLTMRNWRSTTRSNCLDRLE